MKNLYLDKITGELYSSYEDVLAIEINSEWYDFVDRVPDDFNPAKYKFENNQVVLKETNINRLYKKELAESDWKVIRHRDQVDAGLPTSITDEEYQQLLAQRQSWRQSIV